LRELEKKVSKLRLAITTKVTKTMVVEEALRWAFCDFDENGEFGDFFLRIAKKQRSTSYKKIQDKIEKKEWELLELR